MQSHTAYPGVGADDAMNELYKLMGRITASWAQTEDGLFEVFVIATAGTWAGVAAEVYRAVFFSQTTFHTRLQMTSAAVETRYSRQQDLLDQWKKLVSALKGFAQIRNRVAHLAPIAKTTTDPNALANVRLVPVFWKGGPGRWSDFDRIGYSLQELLLAVAPYWGGDPRVRFDPQSEDERYQLGYRLQQFAMQLLQAPGEAATPPAKGNIQTDTGE